MIVQPPSCLLAGPPGSGKTSALATQLLCGLEVFVIMTEPDGVASLLDAAERLKAPIDRLHWTYCPPTSTGWAGIEDMIDKISRFDQKMLADQKDMGKAAFRPAILKLLKALQNFECERTGESYGDFTTWDDTRSLNMDSLSGWSHIGFGATVGYKPTANPGEWGIAQNVIHNTLMKISTDRRCFFNMTAHVEREVDDMTGAKKIMVSTIGAKLAPKIPMFFSEVIKCTREVDGKGNPSFTWSTLDGQMDLKNRALPIAAKLPADFEPVIAAYQRRKKLAGAPSSPAPESAPPAKIATMQTIVPPMHRPAT